MMIKSPYLNAMFLTVLLSPALMGAGIYQNQNQSAEFIGSVNRNASTGPDAVYFNPAGTAFMKDGIYLYFSNQYITDHREVRNSSKAIQTFVAVPEDQEYNGDASTFIYPDIHIVYKKDDMAFFGSASIVGAGASATFPKGLPMFDTLALGYVAAQAGGFENITDYKAGISMEGLQAMLGVSAGGSYRINSMFSVALGVRYVYFMQEAHVEFDWISVKTTTTPNDRLAGAQGAQDFHDMLIDMKADGSAWSIIAGAHAKPLPDMDIGFKLEYHTPLEVTNDTESMVVPAALEQIEDVRKGLDSYRDGATSMKTMPMVMTLGIAYTFFDCLQVEGDFTYFFNRLTDWGEDAYGEKIADKYENGWDVGLALRYAMFSSLRFSMGFTYSKSGRTDKSTNDADIGLDAFTLGVGVSYNVTEHITITAAGMRVFFRNQLVPNDLSKVPDDNKAWLSGDTYLSEETWIGAIGISYCIPMENEGEDAGDAEGKEKQPVDAAPNRKV